MDFAAPLYGWLFLPATAILLVTLWGERNRARALQRFAEAHLLVKLVPPEKPVCRVMRLLRPYLAMLLLILALMQPQWGIVEEAHVSTGLDILFAVDLSRSMLADDLAPSRLAVAKAAVAKVLAAVPDDRVGIIGFAGTAFLLCPLTSDRAIFEQVLAELGTDTLPRRGSALAAALGEAGRAFRGTGQDGRLLVLVSDGEDHGGGIAPAAARLRAAGVTLIPVVAGTAGGGVMPLADGSFVRDRSGAVVKSLASIDNLRQIDPLAIALDADGAAIRERLAQVRSTATATVRKERRHSLVERYQLPLAAALLLWCSGLLFSRRVVTP